MNNNAFDPQPLQDTETDRTLKKDQKHLIRVKIPFVSLVIITSASQIIKLTIILCVFIIAMTLIVKTSLVIPERNIKKAPADNFQQALLSQYYTTKVVYRFRDIAYRPETFHSYRTARYRYRICSRLGSRVGTKDRVHILYTHCRDPRDLLL